METTIDNVTDYIIQYLLADKNKYHLSPAKLHKLLYYVEAWSLGINDKTFFSEEVVFEAWVHGPTNARIQERFANKHIFEDIRIDEVISQEVILNEADEHFINYILDNYACFNGYELEVMCINDQPWQEARKGYSKFEECHKAINRSTMRNFYQQQYENISE
jgi:uncharacterized phage-associated protein